MHLGIGRESFAKKHKRELKGIQKKYLDAKSTKGKVIEETGKVKDRILDKYKEGKLVELEIDIMNSNIEMKSSVVYEIYRQGDLNFVQKYLDVITPKLKNEILVSEYKKGNIDFVYKNFGNIDNGDLKETILSKELNDKNLKFLYENYNYILNKDVKDKIIKYAYKEENIDFLNEHLADMPKAMKLEAAIRFKNLKLTDAELNELLRR